MLKYDLSEIYFTLRFKLNCKQVFSLEDLIYIFYFIFHNTLTSYNLKVIKNYMNKYNVAYIFSSESESEPLLLLEYLSSELDELDDPSVSLLLL